MSYHPGVLTCRQRQLIRLTWDDDFMSLYSLGCDIYAQLFILDPSLAKYFPKLPNFSDAKWSDNPECRTQGLKFVQILSNAIADLDHLNSGKFTGELHSLGQRHRRHIQVPFDPHQWDTFERAIELCTIKQMKVNGQLQDETDLLDAAVGWRTLSRFITATIREGYEAELSPEPKSKSAGCGPCLCWDRASPDCPF